MVAVTRGVPRIAELTADDKVFRSHRAERPTRILHLAMMNNVVME